MRQFFHGLSLPLHLLRALWADPVARRRYLRVAILQSVIILAIGIPLTLSAEGTVGVAPSEAGRAEHLEAAQEERAQERERIKAEVELAAEELTRTALALHGVDKERSLEEAVRELEARTAELTPPAKARAKPTRLKVVLDSALAFWAALFATLQIVQWVVIALSKDFHDAISRDASLLTRIEPEDPEFRPRIRLDFDWVRKKISRRWRAFMVFMVGLPVLFLFTLFLPMKSTLLAILVPIWSAYWLVVFTAAKSARAWDHSDAGEPWFLRGWNWFTTRVPGFRWGFLQRYGRFWGRKTSSVFPPASEVEKLPWAFAGLGLVKALAILPLTKCFLRPLIPVASAHLLIAQRAASPAPSSQPPVEPAPASSANAV